MPRARPKPCAKAVLPAPISPANTMMSPVRARPATAAATAWVPASESTRSTSTGSDATSETAPDVGASGHVDAGDPRADRAHDLVADRAEPVGPVLGADLLVALAAQQHDLVADRDRQIADVDHQLVHRDDAHDRAAASADQHVGARPGL